MQSITKLILAAICTTLFPFKMPAYGEEYYERLDIADQLRIHENLNNHYVSLQCYAIKREERAGWLTVFLPREESTRYIDESNMRSTSHGFSFVAAERRTLSDGTYQAGPSHVIGANLMMIVWEREPENFLQAGNLEDIIQYTNFVYMSLVSYSEKNIHSSIPYQSSEDYDKTNPQGIEIDRMSSELRIHNMTNRYRCSVVNSPGDKTMFRNALAYSFFRARNLQDFLINEKTDGKTRNANQL